VSSADGAEGLGGRWGALAGQPASDQIPAMQEVFAELLKLDETERLVAIEEMVRAEYALDQDALKAFTESRLRSWLAMAANDLESTQEIVQGYDTVFGHLPGEMAMRRATVVQTVARNHFTTDEVGALFELIPSLVRQVPRSSGSATVSASSSSSSSGGAAVAEAPASARPRWKFWAR